MKFQEIGNRKMSIAAKTAIACGVVTLSLLIINATVFQRLESNLVSLIFEGYVNEVDGTIDKQGASQKRDLNTNVSIHAEVLGNAAASFLYDLDKNSLRRMLTAYIRLPELKAVEVLDETGEPYFAIWKDPEIQDMRQIPEDVVIDKSITGTADAIFKEEKVGSVNVYFTDVYLKKQMDVAKQEAKAAINDFRDLVNVKFGNAIWVQRGTILCVVIILIAAIILTMSIIAIRPLKKLTLMVVDLVDGEGDLTKRLELKSHDEIGSLASWFNRFIEQTHGLVREIVSNAKTLNDSSEDMSQIADSLSSGASGMSDRSNSVAAAAGQMSENMTTVASACEEAASKVNMVASAVEEMDATVGEIAQNSEKARTVTEDAVQNVQNASSHVGELGEAANDISKVTEVINEISEQTNLLALNATIEAARAGEAGKGFAVVANEIKELARQTAEATQDIKHKVDGIQSSTATTVSEIELITDVIHKVNELVKSITTAVDEQSTTTREITSNVSDAARGIMEVNENVGQNSAVSGEIAQSIQEVNEAAGQMTLNSSQVKESAEALLILAAQLNTMVGRFKI